MITLVIKGDKEAAFKAADANHVELFTLAKHVRFRECVASTSPEYRAQVVKWFCANHDEAPYSDGTLLFYSERD